MTEATVIKKVRQVVLLRDGYCRLQRLLGMGFCDGPSEWAHYGRWKRWQTMGQDPEFRHCSQGSLMLCKRHHAMYDNKQLHWTVGRTTGTMTIDALSDRNADGPLLFTINGVRYEEAA